MEKELFIVAYTTHNKSTGGNSYKVTLASKDYNDAEKKYHALLGDYIKGPTYDACSVVIFNSEGDFKESSYWIEEEATVTPIYTVSYVRHNKKEDTYAYKTDFASENIDEAIKKYYALLGEFTGGDTFDAVTLILADSFGNRIKVETWEEHKDIVPEVEQ